MLDYVTELVLTVDRATPRLCAIGDEASARHPGPGKWSPREVIGHLIDSASHNHQRFVRAQFQDDLVFAGYRQDDWVLAQRYQDAPWGELVSLWAGFNHHLARVMSAVPEDTRSARRHRHNLHEIAWEPIIEGEPATLDYFMRDYVVHLQHHLRQLLGATWDINQAASASASERNTPRRDRAPAMFETARLIIGRPTAADASEIFESYAADPDVTHFVGWPTHRTVTDTEAFLDFSEAEWRSWPAGPYLVRSRLDGSLIGGTGFSFETPFRAMTGYVFAKEAWGKGYATEALHAMIDVGRDVGLSRLYAICHTEHRASSRVLEKCGFAREGVLRRHTVFPNLRPVEPRDVLCYALLF